MIRILVAESSNLIRSRIVKLLSGIKGITTVEAKSAEELKASCEAEEPDVVILDDQLFRDGGTLDVLREFKTQSFPKNVIVLTTTVYTFIKEKYLEAGADHVFHKSIEFDNMVEMLETMAQNQQGKTG